MAVKLKAIYEKQEEIPEGFGELYAERNGKFEFNAVEGVKTQADIDRVNDALKKERGDHKVVRERLQAFGEVDPATLPVLQEELAAAQARLNTITAEGKLDETKVQAQIDAAAPWPFSVFALHIRYEGAGLDKLSLDFFQPLMKPIKRACLLIPIRFHRNNGNISFDVAFVVFDPVE